MRIFEYQADTLLDQLKEIQKDLENEIISSNTLRMAKILVADLEYYFTKEED